MYFPSLSPEDFVRQAKDSGATYICTDEVLAGSGNKLAHQLGCVKVNLVIQGFMQFCVAKVNGKVLPYMPWICVPVLLIS